MELSEMNSIDFVEAMFPETGFYPSEVKIAKQELITRLNRVEELEQGIKGLIAQYCLNHECANCNSLTSPIKEQFTCWLNSQLKDLIGEKY